MSSLKNYSDVRVETIDVTIHKPLYDNYCNIRDTYLRTAIRQGKLLKVTIPQGTAVVDPKEWVKTGKRVQQVFLRPDEPMTLYGNYVPLPVEKPDTEQLSLI